MTRRTDRGRAALRAETAGPVFAYCYARVGSRNVGRVGGRRDVRPRASGARKRRAARAGARLAAPHRRQVLRPAPEARRRAARASTGRSCSRTGAGRSFDEIADRARRARRRLEAERGRSSRPWRRMLGAFNLGPALVVAAGAPRRRARRGQGDRGGDRRHGRGRRRRHAGRRQAPPAPVVPSAKHCDAAVDACRRRRPRVRADSVSAQRRQVPAATAGGTATTRRARIDAEDADSGAAPRGGRAPARRPRPAGGGRARSAAGGASNGRTSRAGIAGSRLGRAARRSRHRGGPSRP